jgi:hypothetical protein
VAGGHIDAELADRAGPDAVGEFRQVRGDGIQGTAQPVAVEQRLHASLFMPSSEKGGSGRIKVQRVDVNEVGSSELLCDARRPCGRRRARHGKICRSVDKEAA